jgi:hypothetical protein
MTEVRKLGAMVQVSQELLDDALALQESWRRWEQATPEQREQWQREAAAQRLAERERATHRALDLDSLLDACGLSREFAEHLVQPYCNCSPETDGGGWYRCRHAEDLGILP